MMATSIPLNANSMVYTPARVAILSTYDRPRRPCTPLRVSGIAYGLALEPLPPGTTASERIRTCKLPGIPFGDAERPGDRAESPGRIRSCVNAVRGTRVP